MEDMQNEDRFTSGPAAPGRQLDLAPLGRAGSLRARVRAVSGSAMFLVALTIGVLLVLAPSLALLAVLLSDGPVDWGFVVFMGMLLVGGLYVVYDVFAKARTGSRLADFARVNGLELTTSLGARHYAGREFRSGRRIVLHSVRTPGTPCVEVGDSWPLTRIRMRMSGTTHTVTARNAPTAKVFLRAVLSGPVQEEMFFDGRNGSEDLARLAQPRSRFMEPEVHDAVRSFADDYTLEITGDELTVMGTLPLEPTRPERIARAFTLIDALAARADALLVDPAVARPIAAHAPAAPGASAPSPSRGRRGRHPLVVVGAVLAMMIAVPLGIALVMSSIEDHLRGREGLAQLVVSGIVAVVMVIVMMVLRWVTARREPERVGSSFARPRRRRLLLLAGGLVVLLAIAAVAWFALSPREAEEDSFEGLADASECAPEDHACQWEVSQRVWSAERGLTRPYPMLPDSCEVTAPGRAECHLYVDCGTDGAGETALLAVYEGEPWVVIGARPLHASPEEPLSTTDEDVARIVAEHCRT